MDVRSAEEREIDQLARLWFDAWQDAHAQIVPAKLTRLRTLENLKQRLEAAFSDLRVVGPLGAPVGLCVIKGDELYQLFVSAQSRGTGVAAALIADAEARLSARGVETAWLDVCDRQRSGREILREVRMAPGRRRRQPARNAEWQLSAGSVALRKTLALRYFSTPNVNTVLDVNVSPGRSTVDGNAG